MPIHPQDLEKELSTFAFDRSDVPAEHGPRRVLVIEGPDAGRGFELDPHAPSRTLVGTSPACQIQLSDRAVSRRHVALEAVGRRWRITDLGSKNGTFVDGM